MRFLQVLSVYGIVAAVAATAHHDEALPRRGSRTRSNPHIQAEVAAHSRPARASSSRTATKGGQETPPLLSYFRGRRAAAKSSVAASVPAALAGSVSHEQSRALRVSGGNLELDEMREREEQKRVRSVLLYYPNLIGYARVALVLASYYLAETNWKASSCFYLVAFAGDVVDGHVARKFKQASRFGAVLDMVTDRCSTAGLLLVLSRLYDRRHAFAFLVLIVVEKHHKSTATLKRRNILIRTYYDNLPFFAFCCIGAELFYVLLYLLHFVSEESRAFTPLRTSCFWLCLPACVLKQFVNIAQIFSAASCLALEELDQKER
ncbi:unnamed protein product [Ectocarpus sp. CCAP 1310/34]|nr:unnamed protein product [Ectocarpus sp. CCAP 1310/34]